MTDNVIHKQIILENENNVITEKNRRLENENNYLYNFIDEIVFEAKENFVRGFSLANKYRDESIR